MPADGPFGDGSLLVNKDDHRVAGLGRLVPAAIVITLVGFMESIAVGKVYARRDRYEIDPSLELIGLGVANVGSGLIGGYPVTGGFSRTAVNAEAGAKTKVAVVVAARMMTPHTAELGRLPGTRLYRNLGCVVLGHGHCNPPGASGRE